MAKILVTGATGFIGGALCIEFKKLGHEVVGIDLVKRPHILPYMDEFVQGDIFNNYNLVDGVDGVVHCAGYIKVGDSVKDPASYYFNNIIKTIFLLNKIVSENNVPFYFSSSASVYKTKSEHIKEDDVIMPISPYAFSKYSIERICEDYRLAYGLKYCIFRYFNACGSIGAVHGQAPGASHIFPKLFENNTFTLNGDDFDTEDGTCIRDYIHVRDIASAYTCAIEEDAEGIYNLGAGEGYSNKQIIDYVADYMEPKTVEVGPRRPGDSAILIADPTRANTMLKWSAKHGLDAVLVDLKQWYGSETFKEQKG